MAKEKDKVKKKAGKGVKTRKDDNLANVYRPQKMSEVVGQDQAVAMLEGMFKRGKFSSAIMLSGHYGSGKTTLAKIFGRQINCEKGTVCGKCFSCGFGDKHPDIVYHDCGQDGKIDTIRSLIGASKISPVTKKRIIILDEVHTLRDASEKALLVETENPSQNAIWILCTTNREKVNRMLVSRCLVVDIKPIEKDVMVPRLVQIAEAEGAKITKEVKKAFGEIAGMSNGSLREAISKLEKFLLILASGKKFDPENSAIFLGDVEVDLEESAAKLLAAIVQKSVQDAVLTIRVTNNARGLIIKTRWLIDYLIGAKTKTAKWRPHAGKLYEDMKIKTSMLGLVLVQNLLSEIEVKLNSMTLDETVVFYSSVGAFIAELE